MSEQAIRKQVVSKLCQSIIIDKNTYILEDDTTIQKLKQNIKNKNSQIREIKLQLKVSQEQNNDKYLQELKRQNIKFEKRNKKLEKKNDKLEDKKDSIYERAIASFMKHNKQLN